MYWTSVYLLPISVINDLEKLFKRFLWNAGDSAKGKARVAWKVVCRPKDQGGLGIKSFKIWNEVLLIRQFWKIIENQNSFWGWKTMLKIIDVIKDHVCNIITRRDIYDAKLDDEAKVTDLINNGQWNWPHGKNSIGNVVNKLVLAATVYFIWQERNLRSFRGESRSEEVVLNAICESVKSKLMSIRVKRVKGLGGQCMMPRIVSGGMSLLGPDNALLKEDRMVMIESVCFKASDAYFLLLLGSTSEVGCYVGSWSNGYRKCS
ncbi:hypothetical protein Tco_0806076 [Tanacetum coccineum]